MPYFTRAFTKKCVIRSYDVGQESLLTLPAALRYLHDTAQDHASSYSFGYANLKELGLAWALVSLEVTVGSLPYGQSVVDLSTSVAAFGGPVVYRDYVVRFGESEILSGQSMWVLIDMGTRKSAPMPQALKQVLRDIEQPIQQGIRRVGRLKSLGDAEVVAAHEVAYHDCDFNGHLNNVVSVRWLLDALYKRHPSLRTTVEKLSVTYFQEVLEGQRVEVALCDTSAELRLDDGQAAVCLRIA